MLRDRARLSSLLYVDARYSSALGVMVWMGHYILFAYNMAVILDTLGFCMESVFYCSNLGLRLNDFNFYVMGYIYCLYCLLFLFCGIVLKVVKLQVISSCSEQNIFILVDKMFQHIFELFSRLIDIMLTYLLNINITKTCTEGMKSSDDEEFRILK